MIKTYYFMVIQDLVKHLCLVTLLKEFLDKGYTVIYQTAFKMFEIIEEYKFRNSDNLFIKR